MLRKISHLILIICGLLLVSCRPQGWEQVFPKSNPPPSGQGAVAFIDSTNTAIIFGGMATDKLLDETWIWNGGTWHQMSPTNSPPARAKLAMAYDVSRDKVVLFGGVTDKTLFNDTWEWNGQEWKLMNPAHNPPARCCHEMAYDSVNKNIVLYGGYDSERNVFLSDIWYWDGNDWTEISSDMPQMSGHAMVSFSARNEIISFETAGYGTWSWDGKMWKNLQIENPPHRSGGKIAYDSKNRQAILFGGLANNQFLNDTWVFDGEKWLNLSLSSSPPERYGHILFYDPKRQSIIIFGGIGNNNSRLGDTWELKLPNNLSNLANVARPSATP